MSRWLRGQRRGTPWYGDDIEECFSRLLGETGCPMPLHQIKTLLLGALAGRGNLPIAHPTDVLWYKTSPGFVSDRQARAFRNLFAGLQERLAIHRDGTLYRLSPIAPQRQMEDLARYIRIRREELDGFHKGLELAGAGPETLAQSTLKAIKHLDQAALQLDKVEGFMERHPSIPAEDLREMFKCLREWEGIVEECLAIIQREQRALRRARRPDLRILPGRSPGKPRV